MPNPRRSSFRTDINEVACWIRHRMRLDAFWAYNEDRMHRGAQVTVGLFEYVGQIIDQASRPSDLDFIMFVSKGFNDPFWSRSKIDPSLSVKLSGHMESAILTIQSLESSARDLGMTKADIFGCSVTARQTPENLAVLENAIISARNSGLRVPSNVLLPSAAIAQANVAFAPIHVPLPPSYKGTSPNKSMKLDELGDPPLESKEVLLDMEPAIDCFGIFKKTCSTPGCKWCKKRADSRVLSPTVARLKKKKEQV